jgi:putative acetyltransferase
MDDIIIRKIRESDNKPVAKLIREILHEHKADKPGTAFFDSNLDQIFQSFLVPHSAYWVAEQNEIVIGGAGIYPTPGLPQGYCELVKLYLYPQARGMGTGVRLISACLSSAINAGYSHVYLETMPELSKATSIYEQLGFEYLTQPLGHSGHYSCNVWMVRPLFNQQSI